MQASAYNGVFGALTQQYRLDSIANNLANVNTTGYKREQPAFKDVFAHYAHDYINPNQDLEGNIPWPRQFLISKPRIDGNHLVFNQGGMQQTGNPLDVAIEGEGFFKVQNEDGIFYSRSGMFRLSPEGTLIDQDGNSVLGDGGPITLPADGTVQIGPEGDLYIDGERQTKIDLVTFENLSALERVGGGLYQIRSGEEAEEIAPENTTMAQGFLEMSNVEVVSEMVNMIETMRIFEACQKVVSSTQETDQKLMTKVGSGN